MEWEWRWLPLILASQAPTQSRGILPRTRKGDHRSSRTCKNGHLWTRGEVCEERGESRLLEEKNDV